MQNSNRSFLSSIPPVTRHLLIINVLVWLATIVFHRSGIYLEQWLALFFWQDSYFNLAQPITHMFMHDTHGFTHIFFNMFSLWMFGGLLERVMGSKRYLFYYIMCGLGAALVQELRGSSRYRKSSPPWAHLAPCSVSCWPSVCYSPICRCISFSSPCPLRPSGLSLVMAFWSFTSASRVTSRALPILLTSVVCWQASS